MEESKQDEKTMPVYKLMILKGIPMIFIYGITGRFFFTLLTVRLLGEYENGTVEAALNALTFVFREDADCCSWVAEPV